ncbi:MAG TPA: CehA/McbA family metallohydrolase [Polyangiales bacterium]|nr:CehA/McbA family metallohydrolase [Polyangiales bacterium]
MSIGPIPPSWSGRRCLGALALALAAVSPARAEQPVERVLAYSASATEHLPLSAATRQPQHDPPFAPFGPLSIAGVEYHPYRFEGHVHTSHSLDALHPTIEILAEAERLGLDALVITDHGASKARFDFARYSGKLTAFVGREIGGEFGHAVMWNVASDAQQIPSRTTLEERARFAHENGGLLVFAHPGWWIDGKAHDPLQWMTPEALRRGGIAGEVDAIELWNGVYFGPLPKLIDAWTALLEAGVFVPIVGNSDFHRFASHKLGNAHNIALCDRPDVATCLWPAVREGRIVVTDGPAAVLSVNDRLPGSVVDPVGAPLRVSVEALAPEGGTLRVYLGKQVVQTLPLPRGERTRAQWEIDCPANDSYVRIDIERPTRRANRPAISLLSNPVLIDVGEQRPSWR